MSPALFAAWRPDAAGRERLVALAASLSGAVPPGGPRMQLRRPDQWHATLCYLGPGIAESAVASLADTFAAVAARVPPHAVTIERLAYWRRPGAVVALPLECAALQALCDATRDAVRSAGVTPEATTQPHITLAYIGRGLDRQAWVEALDCGNDPLRVASFELLFNAGGRYEALGRWLLGGTALPAPPVQGTLL